MDPNVQQDQHVAHRRMLLDWISSTDYHVQQSDYIQRAQDGTGQWFLQAPQVQQWLAQAGTTLFCPGIIGAGKTIMAATTVNYLLRHVEMKHSGVAYVYCNNRAYEEQGASSILAAILKQLLMVRQSFVEPLARKYERHTDQRTKRSLGEIFWILQDVVERFDTVFIIIDALDECSNSDGSRDLLLKKIRELQRKMDVRLLVTSRIIPEIVNDFRNALQLEVRASAEDIRRFVDAQMNRLPTRFQRDTAIQEMVRDEIVQTADGMFLLARLHMESLQEQRTPKAFRAALAGFSNGSKALDFAYEATMETIAVQGAANSEFAMKALSWTTLAKRPMTAAELCSALAIEPDEDSLDPDNIVDVHGLLSLCAGLVSVDEGNDVIQFTHYTIRDYLQRNQDRFFPDAEASIAEACTMYLSFNDFKHGVCRTDEEFVERLRSHCLYDYAAHYWGHHARGCSQLSQKVLDFLQDKPLLDASTQVMFVDSTATTSNYSQAFPKQMSALHISAFFGLNNAIVALFASGHHPNLKDSAGQTPLWWSAKNDHEAATKVLCEKDTITLNLMIHKNEGDLIQSLLKAGYNVNTVDFRKRTPLHNAITSGSVELATNLVFAGANVNAKDMNGLTPLRLALSSKKLDLISVLLQQSANTLDITPLQWRQTFAVPFSALLKLVERREGGHDLHFVTLAHQDDVARMTAQSQTNRYLLQFVKPLSKWPGNPGPVPQMYGMQFFSTEVDDQRWIYSVTTSVPAFGVDHPGTVTIQWNVLWDTDMGCWRSVEHFSMLPYVSLPQNGIEFLQQFIGFVELRWLAMCGQNHDRLSNFRGEVLRKKGSHPGLLDRLLEDGQKWVELRHRLQYHVEKARTFATEYCNRHDDIGAMESFLKKLGMFSSNVSGKISELDDVSKSLIQMEFNLVSINEARLSTSTSTSMKRLSWITFVFLPLLFISGLFGMNIDILASNPPWWLYIIFATGTTLITLIIWIIFKRYPNLEQNIERNLAWLVSPQVTSDEEKVDKAE